MTDKEFEKLLAASSLGTKNARKRIREAEREFGLEGAQRRIDEAQAYERTKLPTEGFQHQFRESDDDEMRCMHCGGYPFDLTHRCNG